MTRRPKRTRVARKPSRKTAKRAKPTPRDPLDDFIAAGARSLGLTIDKSWMPAVRGHLEVTLRLGKLVAEFPLHDEAEPAPVFEA
jgi:hypothetical protein